MNHASSFSVVVAVAPDGGEAIAAGAVLGVAVAAPEVAAVGAGAAVRPPRSLTSGWSRLRPPNPAPDEAPWPRHSLPGILIQLNENIKSHASAAVRKSAVMTICSSCQGTVDAATGQCPECGYGGAGSASQLKAREVAKPELSPFMPQIVDDHITLANDSAATGTARTGRTGEVPDAGGTVTEAAEAEAAEPADAGKADSDDAEDENGLIATYRKRRIHPQRLRSPLKRLMWLAVVQIVIVGLLMAVQKLNQPLVDSDVPGAAGGTFAVPLAVFIVMVFSVAAGYWFGLAGALRVHTSVGISIAALATWALADAPISYLRLERHRQREAQRRRTALGAAWRPGGLLDLARLRGGGQAASAPP
jgi:hypothetical protein